MNSTPRCARLNRIPTVPGRRPPMSAEAVLRWSGASYGVGGRVPRCLLEFSPQGPYGGDFDGFVIVESRQNPGQALGEQCLAGSGCAAHEQVVSSGGGDFESESPFGLALHLGEARGVPV